MDEFEQSDLEKETKDSHNTFYQNAKHYKEKENAFIKRILRVCSHDPGTSHCPGATH